MARLVTSGLDMGLFPTGANASEGEGFLPGGVPSSDTVNPRLGQGRCAKAASGDATARYTGWSIASPTLGRTYYFRSYIRPSALPSLGTLRVMEVYTAAFGFLCAVRLNAAGKLEFLNTAGTVVGTGTTVLPTGAYSRVELSINVASSGASSFTVRLEGVAEITGTATITNTAPGYFSTGKCNAVNPTIDLYWDDVALNDDQGSDQNSWAGDGKITLLKPAADSAVGVFQKPGGGTTNLYTSVDNIPPVGIGDSTNVADAEKSIRGGFAAGNYDVTLQDYVTAGVENGAIVKVVQALASVGRSVASPAVNGQIRMLANPSESDPGANLVAPTINGTHASATGGNHLVARGAKIYSPTVVYGTGPTLRLRKTDAAAQALYCDSLGAYVEWQHRPPAMTIGGQGDMTAELSASRVEVEKLEVGGHSYAHEDGASAPANGFVHLMQAALPGSPPINNWSIGGSQIGYNGAYTPPGGLLGQDTAWWITRNPALIGSSADASAPYDSRPGLHLLFHGVNDLNAGPVAVPTPSTIADLKTMISRLRCAAVFEDNDASISSVAGDWISTSATNLNSGSTKLGTSSASASDLLHTIPADFPGGHYVLSFIGQDTASGAGVGGVFDIYLDGVLHGQLDARGGSNATGGGLTRRFTYRLNNLPASMAGKVIRMDLVTLVTAVWLDWVGFEKLDAPKFLIWKQPRLPAGGYAAHGGGVAKYGDADVNTFNAALDTMAADFPAKAIGVVDLPLMHGNASYFFGDLLHPNDTGHAYIASQGLAKLREIMPLFFPEGMITGGVGNLTGTLSVRTQLSATIGGSGGFNPNLSVGIPLAATIASASSMSAQLGAAVQEIIAGIGNMAANATVTKPLAGTADGAGSMTADLRIRPSLNIAGAGNLSGALTVTKPLAAAIDGTSGVSAVLGVAGTFQSFIDGSSNLQANATVQKPLAATAAGVGSMAATLTVQKPLAAVIGGTSSTQGELIITKLLGAGMSGSGSLVPDAVAEVPLAATMGGSSSAGADLSQSIDLGSASMAGTSSMEGKLRSRLATQMDGVGTLTGTLIKLPARPTINSRIGKPDVEIDTEVTE